MAQHAKITSVEALEDFQTALVLYLDKARQVIDEISDEVKRTRSWLEADRRMHWLNEVKRRTRVLETRQQELFSAQIGHLAEPTQSHRHAVHRAKRALDEAQEKVDRIRRWIRDFDNHVAPLARHVDQMRHVLGVDMMKGVSVLKQHLDALHQYAEVAKLGRSTSASEGSA